MAADLLLSDNYFLPLQEITVLYRWIYIKLQARKGLVSLRLWGALSPRLLHRKVRVSQHGTIRLSSMRTSPSTASSQTCALWKGCGGHSDSANCILGWCWTSWKETVFACGSFPFSTEWSRWKRSNQNFSPKGLRAKALSAGSPFFPQVQFWEASFQTRFLSVDLSHWLRF